MGLSVRLKRRKLPKMLNSMTTWSSLPSVGPLTRFCVGKAERTTIDAPALACDAFRGDCSGLFWESLLA